MTYEEAIYCLTVMRNEVLDTWEFDFSNEETDALRLAIEAMELQVAKKPYNDNENGVYEKDYCPNCHRSLFPYEHHCKCGKKLDWSE